MNDICVVGTGILGLAAAEFLSRRGHNVTVVSNEKSEAGSQAAAANLGIKGQQFARDRYFAHKLRGRALYPTWLERLCYEVGAQDLLTPSFFRVGRGCDCFTSPEQARAHFSRVWQDPLELLDRGLSSDTIRLGDANTILYEGEAWVDGQRLMTLIRQVLASRNVEFVLSDFETFYSDAKFKHYVICAGAFSKSLLQRLGLPQPKGFQQKERITYGSTFYLDRAFASQFTLVENSTAQTKFTLSGNETRTYFTSSHQRSTDLVQPSQIDALLIEASQEFMAAVRDCAMVTLSGERSFSGVRVRYGQSELVVERLGGTQERSVVVCTGAHKSGFLYAPVVGELILNEAPELGYH